MSNFVMNVCYVRQTLYVKFIRLSIKIVEFLNLNQTLVLSSRVQQTDERSIINIKFCERFHWSNGENIAREMHIFYEMEFKLHIS